MSVKGWLELSRQERNIAQTRNKLERRAKLSEHSKPWVQIGGKINRCWGAGLEN